MQPKIGFSGNATRLLTMGNRVSTAKTTFGISRLLLGVKFAKMAQKPGYYTYCAADEKKPKHLRRCNNTCTNRLAVKEPIQSLDLPFPKHCSNVSRVSTFHFAWHTILDYSFTHDITLPSHMKEAPNAAPRVGWAVKQLLTMEMLGPAAQKCL